MPAGLHKSRLTGDIWYVGIGEGFETVELIKGSCHSRKPSSTWIPGKAPPGDIRERVLRNNLK
ncbi:hypothetical protein QQ020_05980 [Fulvivirgaceae bacterium BMA12]|uniref:Uncharacterized protein n=1 Tax=Agaribacillus aureus TaxID=3051825 RepID=A0ABT8L1I4_9BACT|nr:hypothetical protein [Fulvivirgaceae bacterium BMA12]